MVVDLEGSVYKAGVTKKGQHFCNVLVKRPDGQADSITVFGDVEHKTGSVFKGKVNVYVQLCNEVAKA